MLFEKDKPDKDDDQCRQEHKNGDAVDAMHITHPAAVRRIGISFFDVEIFCYLTEHTHKTSYKYTERRFGEIV